MQVHILLQASVNFIDIPVMNVRYDAVENCVAVQDYKRSSSRVVDAYKIYNTHKI